MSDAAERALMQADGISSLLVTPVVGRAAPLGILEFRHRTHRRWSSQDMAQARILAEHIASVLMRMPNSQPASGFPRGRRHIPVAS
jgi:GAF domain-containing protein